MGEEKRSLNKLSQLVKAGDPQTRQSGVPAEMNDEGKIAEDAQQILDFVNTLAGDNIFDAQILIEYCAEELRVQIRELVEGPEEGGEAETD